MQAMMAWVSKLLVLNVQYIIYICISHNMIGLLCKVANRYVPYRTPRGLKVSFWGLERVQGIACVFVGPILDDRLKEKLLKP